MPIVLDGSNGITQAEQFNSDSTFGFKNRIINGAMVIDQRNAGASVTPSDGTFILDRWKWSLTQASKLSSQQSATAPTGFVNSMLVTSLSAYSVASNDTFGVSQPIEGFNVADFGWGTANAKTVTVSFWVRSSITGTFSVSVYNNAVNRSCVTSYTINAANTWEYKTITIVGDTTGTWTTNNTAGIQVYWTLAAGSGTFGGATSGTWNATIKTAVTGQASVVGTSGATFYITGVQLEVGSTATSFDYRPYGTELMLCQRYFEVISNYGSNYSGGGLGQAYGSTVAIAALTLKVLKRAQPSMTFTAANTFILTNSTNGALTVTAIGTDTVGQATVRVSVTVASGLTAGNVTALVSNATANGSIYVSAEL